MSDFVHSLRQNATALLAISSAIAVATAWSGVNRLAYERERLTAAEVMALAGSRPRAPLLRNAMAFTHTNRRDAIARFAGQLREAASRHRLLVERLDTVTVPSDPDTLLTVRIAVSGSEADIRDFASTVESASPAIRFAEWRVAPTGTDEASIRIEARALALWHAGA